MLQSRSIGAEIRVLFVAAFATLLTAGPQVDACALLTNVEIEAVLGDSVKERRPNTEPAGGLLMAQCFFGTSSAKSVSMAVAETNTAGRARLSPRTYWRTQFHPANGREKERELENRPRPIRGVGEEAYWAGNRIAGALYVLQGKTFLRISVGGIRSERERIERSKALATSALKRLPGP